MSKAEAAPGTERHLTCRNIVWETVRTDGSSAPGRYCANRLGILHLLDCPVFQGEECCLFEVRGEDEEPFLPDEDELDRIRGRLAQDYLRWPYWRRLQVLREPEAPAIEVEDLPDVIEAGAEDETEEPTEVTVRRTAKPSPPEEALRERYPGQRRSEEGQRSRREREKAAPPRDLDQILAAGILPAREAAPPDAGPPTERPPEKPPEMSPEKPPETLPEKPAGEPEKKKQKSRRRRGRRRRKGGRGKAPPKR